MGLSNVRFGKSFLMSAFAVVAAVGICSATLLFLRPWPQHSTADAIVSARDITEAAQAEHAVTPPLAELGEGSSPAPASDKTDDLAEQPPVKEPGDASIIAETQDAAAVPTEPSASRDPIGEKLAALPPTTTGAPAHTDAVPTIRSPARLSKAEVDDALKPLLAYDLSGEDIKNLKEVVRLVQRDEFSAARPAIGKISDAGAKKLAVWYYYRAGASDATAEEITAFRESNALWPDRDVLEQRAEEALFWRETNPKKILAYFQERRPVSGPGKAALGGALIATGKAEDGKALIRTAWREHYLTPAIESRLKDNFAETLRPEDHKARLDWLLVKNRKSDLKTIERLVPLVDKKWEPAIQAQIASIKGEKNAATLLDKLDGGLKNDPAVLLARIVQARKADKEETVWELLRAAPTDASRLVSPMTWWDHRASQIRNALNNGNAKTAYALARGHGGELPAEESADAEFLAGWISLRFLNDAKTAHKHLLASAAAGGLPKHRARANYWLGRSELVLGDKRSATTRFAEAAQYTHTFYGQLSRQMAEPKAVPYTMRPYARPSKADIRSFTRNPALIALAAANKADLEGLVPVFLDDLARQITEAPDMTLACELAARITGAHRAVRMAKIAMNRGFPVELYAYPDVLPEFKSLSSAKDLEEPLLHALTRQESEFNPTIVSSAGAIGLMQLLPSTAKEVAKAHEVKFDKKKLSSDPSYNLSLGSAFLHRLISSYDGSYVMALAAYNAGPGRVRQWVRQLGDPRDKKVDPIDWIERIPFTETREYVLKIMESSQVYRARLGRNTDALRLAQDLHRGRSDNARSFLEAGMH
jgi:soluble lytic murein transglycosylase